MYIPVLGNRLLLLLKFVIVHKRGRMRKGFVNVKQKITFTYLSGFIIHFIDKEEKKQ